MKVLAVLRDPCFSPNSVEKDRAILMTVVRRLQGRGHEVDVKAESELADSPLHGYETVFSMGRFPETLAQLKGLGVPVINSPEGVARCQRKVLQHIMETAGVPVPPKQGEHGYWLKRGDTAAAQTEADVVYAADEEELQLKISEFRRRGLSDYTVSAHVVGDVVKFYGVRGTAFFRYFYTAAGGESKFGDEQRHGQARYYPFEVADLRRVSEQLAGVVGVDVYGGDAIVRQDGTFCIIDFNDWPSFSRCREEAAEAVAELVSDEC